MVCSVLSSLATIVVILILVKYCKMSSILATLVIDSQLPPPVPAISQLPGSVGIMAIACHTLIDGLQSAGMGDNMPCNSFKGLQRAVDRCEHFMTLFNKIYNDTAQLPPLGTLMQVQEPSDIPEKTVGINYSMVIISKHNIGYNYAGSWTVSSMQTIDLVLWL